MKFLLHRRALIAGLLMFCLTLFVPTQGLFAQSPKLQWSRAIPLSGALANSWYPSLASDDNGQIVLIWSVSGPDGSTLYTTRFDGAAWSRPIDILLGGPLTTTALDGRGTLSVMYLDGDNLSVAQSDIPNSNSAQNWQTALNLNRNKGATNGDMLIDSAGILHAAWFESSDACRDCLRIVYNDTSDPANMATHSRVIYDSFKQAQPLQLLRTNDGEMYAIWHTPAAGDTKAGLAISFSKNNGENWLDQPLALTNSDGDILKPYVFLDTNDKLVAVYNLSNKDETFFQVSDDGGGTWSDPAPVPGLFASKPAAGNDYFASAKDSSGTVHLIATGRSAKDQVGTGVYHLTWDGKAWGALDTISVGDAFAEMPAISIANGNRLNVSFVTRDRNRVSADPDPTSQVWFSTALTAAAAATRVPLPTLTPTLTPTATPGPTGTPTVRPSPTPVSAAEPPSPDSPGDVNLTTPLIIGIVPVIAILGVVVVANMVLRRRR